MNKLSFINNTPYTIKEVIDVAIDKMSVVFSLKNHIKDKDKYKIHLKILNDLFSKSHSIDFIKFADFIDALQILTIKQKLSLIDHFLLLIFDEIGTIKNDSSSNLTTINQQNQKIADLEIKVNNLEYKLNMFEQRFNDHDTIEQTKHRVAEEQIEKITRFLSTLNTTDKFETTNTQAEQQTLMNMDSKLYILKNELNKVIWLLNNGFNIEDALLRAAAKNHLNSGNMIYTPHSSATGATITMPIDNHYSKLYDFFIKEIY